MDPFEFVLSLIAIVTVGGIITSIVRTVGKVASGRLQRPELKAGSAPGGSPELDGLREAIDHVSGRVAHLEEERDFYKDLLDSPGARSAILPPGVEQDASDT